MASAGNHQRVAGQTIWAGQVAGGEAGMAWDWVEISSGIVAMADPMSVLTNLRIIGDEGEVLTAQAAARFLTGIVHALPWTVAPPSHPPWPAYCVARWRRVRAT